MDVEVKFVGGPELNHALSQLPINIERKVARQALRMGAKVFQKHLEVSLPMDPTPDGVHLRKSISISRPRGMSKFILLRVGYKGLARKYGHVTEFGNSEISPNPVWRRAASQVGNQAVKVVIDKLVAGVNLETKRLFKKTI